MGILESRDAKRKKQLSRSLIISLMGESVDGGELGSVSLVKKMMNILESDLDSGDDELRYKAIDKIIRILPMVMPKEKQNNTTNILNAPGGKFIDNGQVKMASIQSIDEYLKKRNNEMNGVEISDAIIIPETIVKKAKEISEISVIREEVSIRKDYEFYDDLEEGVEDE